MTEQTVKKCKSRGSYQGGLDPEKPAKTLSDHENLGEIGDRTVKKKTQTHNSYRGTGSSENAECTTLRNFYHDFYRGGGAKVNGKSGQ